MAAEATSQSEGAIPLVPALASGEIHREEIVVSEKNTAQQPTTVGRMSQGPRVTAPLWGQVTMGSHRGPLVARC